jgi:uncharacterized membrane protein
LNLEVYLADWLNLILRWAHIITGIAWIGSSFYFIWLDARLNVPARDPENDDILGDLWAVHGGGFYHAQKYKVAPAELPEPLHWFKWEAYFTWITGFLLLTLVYYLNAKSYLIDPRVADIGVWPAVSVSLGLLVVGWLLYSALCTIDFEERWFALLGCGLIVALAWALSHVFSGRGMFMQVGAMLGTIMAANVFFVIIPSQKQLVAAKQAGVAPDAALGMKAKRRSVHNNYLTLPVVFVMISPHYAITYTHRFNWLVLFVIFLAGALVRHYFNLRNRGRHVIALPIAAVVVLGILAAVLVPRGSGGMPEAVSSEPDVSFSEVRRIIAARCVTCHSSEPTHPTAPVPAAGVVFDSEQDIAAWAARIYERTAVNQTMPLANLTRIKEEERAAIARWYVNGAKTE